MSDAGDFELIEPRGKAAPTPPAAPVAAAPASDFELVKPDDLELAKPKFEEWSLNKWIDPARIFGGQFGSTAAPVLNALNPLPAVAADAAALAHGNIPTDEKSRKAFYERRQKALDTMELPETSVGRAISGALSLPGQAIQKGAQFAGEQTLDRLIPGATKAIGPYATMGLDAANVPLALGAAKLGAGRRAASAPAEDVAKAKAENRARRDLSKSFERGLYEGGPSALDAVEEMQKARAAGQPYALLDVNNPEMQGRIGTTYRQGGAGQGVIKDFLETRHDEQVPRAQRIIGEGLGDANTFRDTADALKERRSANAKPLFDAAAEGPGLKALEHQFTQAFQEAGRVEHEAQQRVAQADAALTQAKARQSQGGNVYSTSAANAAVREAEAALASAQKDLTGATDRKGRTQTLMQQAQSDGTWRPDATWSPYLQMLLDDNPHVKRGIRRGWDIERNKAHAVGEQPNPRDYAIVGFDAKGAPIVGTVPNMRLWMVAKEGLDATIESRIKKKGGEVDKTTHALIALRNGLTNELDGLNPRYKVARDQWSGDSASRMALDRGEHLLDEKWFKTDADVSQYLGTLSHADREFVKLGLAQKMLADVRRAPDAADKAKRVVNTDVARSRLELLLGPDAERFLEAVEREADMEKSRQGIKGNSMTAQRAAEDKRNERLAHAGVGVVGNLLHGHPLAALHSAGRGVRALFQKPDLRMNEAIGRLATDPNLALQTGQGQRLLPRVDVPWRSRLTGPRAYTGTELAMPHDDDPVTRALGNR
jgi:hypothetical protein